MKKITYSIALATGLLLLAFTTQAQSRVSVDPGISVNNYKHPNKARKAKSMQTETGQAAAIVEPRLGNRFSNTPKYANRPGARVFLGTESGRDVHLNPLNDSNHYKTPANATKSEDTDVRYAVKDSAAKKDEAVRID